jgi:outer membrane protein TolC
MLSIAVRAIRPFRLGFGAWLLLVSQLSAQSPLSIDLHEAVRRAQTYNAQFLAGGIGVSVAEEARKQARAATLPSASLLNQYAFTQPNGADSGIFIANNGVHEFAQQALAHAEPYSVAKRAEYRRTLAAQATAKARLDIAARGLIGTVAQYYYSVVLAERRMVNAQSSLEEARRFEDLTRLQEQGGEVARADVVKAQLQRQQRERDALEADVNIEKAKIGLAVLLFADLNQAYAVVDDLREIASAAPPAADETRARGLQANPVIQAAESSVQETRFGVQAARGEYLPTLTLDYFFGIDSNNFAYRNSFGQRNLGSSAIASLSLPVWNWGATRSRVRQAELARQQAENELRLTRRDVQAGLEALHLEARIAQMQLPSLRESVDLAAESLRLTNLRYQGGEATALEVVDAQSAAALARDGYDAGLARYRLALVSIQANTGTF